jgi:hypothetical protein
MDIDRIKVWI